MQLVDIAENNKVITSENKSQSRILAFDLARGIAIVAMVVIHSIVFLGGPSLVNTIPGYLANSIICLIAAPVFTFIMGVMISLSSKSSPRTLLIRGLTILAIGYALNMIRGVIPMAVGEWAEWVEDLEENPLVYLLEDDILQWAGVTFILIALLKKVIPWNRVLAGIAVAIMAAAPILWTIQSDIPGIGYMCSLLFGGEEYNFFPVVPWIAFPLIGMYYGELMKKSSNKKAFFLKSLIIGAVVCALGSIALFFDSHHLLTKWYKGAFRQGKLPFPVSMVFTGFLFMWISVCYFFTEEIKFGPILKRLYFWSNNVTWFYVLQWIIIGWACVMLPQLSWWQVTIAIIIIMILTDRIMISFVKKKTV